MPPSNSEFLKVEGLEKRFGGIIARADYDIEIHPNEFVGLIGPTGAWKTTVFNLLSGVLKPTQGRIFFHRQDITRLRPDQNAALGIARTFQNIRLFNEMSAIDNVNVKSNLQSLAFKYNYHCMKYSKVGFLVDTNTI